MSYMIRVLEQMGRWGFTRGGARSNWFDSSVGRVHYFTQEGKGSLPPVVLLHGLGSSALGYAQLVQSVLPHTSSIVAVDTPAHGDSAVPSSISPDVLFEGVKECLDQLSIERFHLAGNSLGGGMATQYALHAPERLESLFLMSPAGAPTQPEELPDFLSRFHIDERKDAVDFMERLFHSTPWYRPMIASFIRANFKRPEIRAFLSSVSGDKTDADFTFQPNDLGSLKMPVCLVWGKADRIMPPSHFPFYRKHLPEGSVIHQPPHVGHSPQVERPDMIADMMLDFWRAN